jgi:hypothetical protein
LGSPASLRRPRSSQAAQKGRHASQDCAEKYVVSRRALIVTDVALACLFVAAGVTDLVLRAPVSIAAGISALAIGAACAVTACLFVAAGGWSRDRVSARAARRKLKRQRQAAQPESQPT